MTRGRSPVSEPFTPDKRRAMTPARKRRIWLAWDGRCWFCDEPVPESGPGVVYDHIDQLWVKGSDADEHIGPIHAAPCNKTKTADDARVRAHIKRIIARREGTRRARKPIRNGRKLEGPGFDKTRTKGLDGKVRRR